MCHTESRKQQGRTRCDIDDCAVDSMFHFIRLESRHFVSETYYCEQHAQSFVAESQVNVSVPTSAQTAAPADVSLDLEMIVYHKRREETPACLYLREVGGNRRIRMVVDGWAWWALVD